MLTLRKIPYIFMSHAKFHRQAVKMLLQVLKRLIKQIVPPPEKRYPFKICKMEAREMKWR